ncbi:lambda-exonuclease family protein [Methylibium petroleiphilum]|uniref:lambda-exonuclease family protein n=1 Tax=Methylibium petroleiphilum TaxID=105560 RepID=UPI001ED933AA|nr:YqaJ viral recombinase family protein [Methylibium petroleiphilum]
MKEQIHMGYRVVSGAQAKQGTPEWLAWRLNGLGASDAPAVMGRSKWTTPYGLYRQKIGLDPGPKMNPAMMRGIKLEPKARAAYEKHTGNIMVPMVLESTTHPILRASLDGLEIDGSIALEVKCPGEEAHMLAKNGLVPDYYVDQTQQQLLVSGAKELHYWSFDGDNGALVIVYPDPARQQAIIDASLRFWERVTARVWESDEWAAAATLWRALKMESDAAAEREEAARKALISLLADDEQKREGAGVIVTRVTRKGTVDMAKLLASKGFTYTPEEEEKFRKKDSTTVQVREAATAEEINPEALQMPKEQPKSDAKVDPIATVVDDSFILTV